MKDAQNNGHLVPASANSLDVAACPACRGEVRKRKRKNGKRYTYFYRHRIAVDADCPLRHRPTA